MRVCVLGHQGMLGHMVVRYLAQMGHEVRTVSQRFLSNDVEAFLHEVQLTQSDWCINCIGVRAHDRISSAQLFAINAELPRLLAESLPPSTQLIHASTDGVFQNHPSDRLVSDIPDATDDYGLSKRQAESVVLAANHYVIRCSIIGPELTTSRSLFSWALSQRGRIPGFTNHSWNGVTSLEWAKLCQRLVNGERFGAKKLLQPGFTPACSKHELLTRIIETWHQDVRVEALEAQCSVSRTLVPNISTPTIGVQLRELQEYP